MKTIFLSLLLLSLKFSENAPTLDKKEAQAAFTYLNKVRTQPSSYTKELTFLANGIKPMHKLKWNETLAKVAEAKALDMATNNYFAHVDGNGYGINYYINKAGYTLNPSWLKNPKTNYFESCNAGGLTGVEAIKMLLIDEGVPTLGHRKHLLGIESWNEGLVDIGIGYVRSNSSTTYRTYTCVIIAKHK
jgi:uncharacterized protein YkwD